MIALIPAAGLGTRFLPFTKSVPKELVPIMGIPAIQYVLKEAINSNITSFGIISSNEKSILQEYLTENASLSDLLKKKNKLYLLEELNAITQNCTITFINQPAPLGLGHAILCAQKSVPYDNSFISIMLPDELLFTNEGSQPDLLKKMYELGKEHNASVIAVKKVMPHQTGAYGIISGKPLDGLPGVFLVDSVVEKPIPEQAPSRLAIIGRYVLEKAIFDVLPTLSVGSGGEIQLTDGIGALIKQGRKVIAYEYTENRFDVGNPAGCLAANIFANEHFK